MLLALIFGFCIVCIVIAPQTASSFFVENPMQKKAFIQIISMGIDFQALHVSCCTKNAQ